MDVLRFTDYRSFLLAHAQDAKRTNPKWTYGIWARKLGVKDISSITKILQGQRDPGSTITEKLVRYFSFSPKEAEYFRDLVRLQKIKKDPRLSVLLLEKMSKSHPGVAMRILDEKSFALISNWYCTTIREMVRLDTFFEDPEWISKKLRFKITPRDAFRAIELLIQSGLLKRDSKGKLEIASPRYQTKNDFASEAVKRYHEGMLENAKLSLRSIPVEEREITASVLTMRYANIDKAKELIREFKDRFCRLLEEDGGDGTFQFQIQFFPLTKKGERNAH